MTDERTLAHKNGFEICDFSTARRFSIMTFQEFNRIYRPYAPYKLMNDKDFAELHRCVTITATSWLDEDLRKSKDGRDDNVRKGFDWFSYRPKHLVENPSIPMVEKTGRRVNIDPSYRDDYYTGGAIHQAPYADEPTEEEPWSYYWDPDWDGDA